MRSVLAAALLLGAAVLALHAYVEHGAEGLVEQCISELSPSLDNARVWCEEIVRTRGEWMGEKP